MVNLLNYNGTLLNTKKKAKPRAMSGGVENGEQCEAANQVEEFKLCNIINRV